MAVLGRYSFLESPMGKTQESHSPLIHLEHLAAQGVCFPTKTTNERK